MGRGEGRGKSQGPIFRLAGWLWRGGGAGKHGRNQLRVEHLEEGGSGGDTDLRSPSLRVCVCARCGNANGCLQVLGEVGRWIWGEGGGLCWGDIPSATTCMAAGGSAICARIGVYPFARGGMVL